MITDDMMDLDNREQNLDEAAVADDLGMQAGYERLIQQETRSALDAAGLRYYEAKITGNDAVMQSAACTIFEIAYRTMPKYAELLGLFYEKRLKNYDPNKGNSFSKYLYWQLRMLEQEAYYRDNGYQRISYVNETTGKNERRYVRLYTLKEDTANERDTSESRAAEYIDEAAEQSYEDVVSDATLFCLFTTAILLLPQRLHGRANNPAKLMAYRMFFTDDMTSLLKVECEQLGVYSQHERDLFRAMDLPFLDFYMESLCRTVSALAAGKLKRYSALVDGRSDTETKCPLPQDVYVSFLKRTEDREISLGALSQQRTAYRKYLGQVRTAYETG